MIHNHDQKKEKPVNPAADGITGFLIATNRICVTDCFTEPSGTRTLDPLIKSNRYAEKPLTTRLHGYECLTYEKSCWTIYPIMGYNKNRSQRLHTDF